MRRRDFITLLGGAAAAWPLAARAQQAKMPLIGYLGYGTQAVEGERFAAIQRGLSDFGFVDGRNLAVEYRWAEYHADRIPPLIDELVRRQVTVIFVNSTAAALAAKAATQLIPIVFSIGVDPVEVGLVGSLGRPGGNVTGTYNLNIGVAAKRLELLHELVPSAATIGYLVNPANTEVAKAETHELDGAAQALGVRLLMLNVGDAGEFDAAFATLARERAGAVLISSDVFFSERFDELIALAARHAVPAMNTYPEVAAAGGLISYGTDRREGWRQSAIYIGRILKGEKPADLPVQQATKIELVINLKTAKALGITVPISLLTRADELIE
jgi:putative ABC transport system substrate-binding protein